MCRTSNSSTPRCRIRVLYGPHLGSSKRPYHARVCDAADMVMGLAERRWPTTEQGCSRY